MSRTDPAPALPDEPADITEAEREFRALLCNRPAYAKWAKATREAWALTPEGIEAADRLGERTGKKKRRVDMGGKS